MTVAAQPGFATGSQKVLGHLAGLLFALLIAGSFSIGHLAAPYIAPAALNALRFAIAVLILFAIYGATYRKFPAWPKAAWRFGIIGALGLYCFWCRLVSILWCR